ncbi:MAG: chemotaxis protein CheX [Luteolibacter sp.]
MNPSPVLTAPDLAVFVKLVTHCFATVSGTPPVFGASTIELGPLDLFKYSGFIVVQGPLNGWICLSLPATVADGLLEMLSEPSRDEIYRLDIAGEVAQTVAANARERFGERLQIQPALVTGNSSMEKTIVQPPMTLRLPFTWRDHSAQLLVGLNS